MPILEESTRTSIKRLYPYLAKYKKRVFLAGLSMSSAIILQLPLPLLTMYIIDNLISPEKTNLLTTICVGLIGVLIFRNLSSMFERYMLTKFRLRVMFDLKQELYDRLLKLPLDYFHKKQTGYLLSRISGDVEGVQGLFAETLLNVLRNLLTFVVGLVMVYWLNVKLAIIATLLLPLYLTSLLLFNSRIRDLQTAGREAQANTFKYLQEHISGIAVVKAFVSEKHDMIGMLGMLKVALRKEFKSNMVGTVAAHLAAFISSMGPIILLWVGILEIINGRLTLGGLIAFNSFLAYLFSPINSISNINISVQNSLACAKRVFEFADQLPETGMPDTGKRRQNSFDNSEVVFDNVSFSYGPQSDLVLKNVSFAAPARKVTAVVGRSGVGKSSLVNLLFRFYDYQDGSISIDGHNISEFDLYYLRRNIGLVTQETFLFGYSILENIRLGNLHATDEDVVAAARAAYAHDFIMNLPEKYETRIGERGALISGGERQRIALARVFLKDPKILILDEATSSLDSHSEKIVQMAMEKLYTNRTVIIISHRLSTIIKSDQIVFIDDGRVIDSGNHHQLHERCELYHQLYNEQFAGQDTKVVG
jgi:ABC-type multidrug transport system fused ATPase/permease subunit